MTSNGDDLVELAELGDPTPEEWIRICATWLAFMDPLHRDEAPFATSRYVDLAAGLYATLSQPMAVTVVYGPDPLATRVWSRIRRPRR
jgi:hypothetical protein